MSLDAAFIKGMSKHEFKFAALWDAAEGPSLVREFKFHQERKWRFDFVVTYIGLGDSWTVNPCIAFELEGGTWMKGGRSGHTGRFAERDAQKFLEATLLGWTVFRLNEKQLNAPTINRLIEFTKTIVSRGFKSRNS